MLESLYASGLWGVGEKTSLTLYVYVTPHKFLVFFRIPIACTDFGILGSQF